MAKERIGIMGGTFNPVHQGHVDMARAAAAQENLDKVLFLPTGNPPHKHEGVVDAEDRYRMVASAIAQEPAMVPSRLELERSGVIYTVDTLTLLKEKYPKAQFYYVIGADTLMELKHWRNYEKVLTLCTFLVCPRMGSASPLEMENERKRLTEMGGSFTYIRMQPVDTASTQIRQTLALGKEPELLPPVCDGVYPGLRAVWSGKPPAPGPRMAGTALGSIVRSSASRIPWGLPLRHAAWPCSMGLIPTRLKRLAYCMTVPSACPWRKMQRICQAHALTQDPSLLESGNLLHSVAGAFLAASSYHVSDPEVLRAISCHTTGKVGMNKLDMVVYLADKIEPGRAPYPLLDQVRAAAQLSLPRAMLLSLEGTAKYVKKRREAAASTHTGRGGLASFRTEN